MTDVAPDTQPAATSTQKSRKPVDIVNNQSRGAARDLYSFGIIPMAKDTRIFNSTNRIMIDGCWCRVAAGGMDIAL